MESRRKNRNLSQKVKKYIFEDRKNLIYTFIIIPKKINATSTTYSNKKELYLIIIVKLSGGLYQQMPSHTAHLFQGNQNDAAQTFSILTAGTEEMTVRQYITEKYIEVYLEEDEIYQEDEEPRKATDEEI